MRDEERERYSGIACDEKGIITHYGKGAEEIFGWKAEEVVGKRSVAIFHTPENVKQLVPRLLRTAVDKGVFEEEVVLVRKNGERFRAILRVRPLYKEGRLVGYMGLTKELKEGEEGVKP